MKKLSFLLVIFISLTAFTCENEALDDGVEEAIVENPTNPNNPTNPSDPSNPSDPTSIVGTWSAVSLDAGTESSVTVGDLTTSATSVITGENLDYTVTFTDNETFSTQGNYDITYTVTTPDETATSTQNYTNVSGTGTYEITGANMMTVGGAFYDLQVDGLDTSAIADMPQELQYTLSADGQTLTFVQDQQEVQDVEGIVVSTTVTSTSVFTRQ
ncbi:hypothetical protein U8527_15885 [Kordia algicida OT-1]|uniref:Lipocalin-like domain-containing protein n=1 Tax=Kordia algicida OT-1 TaxID=391587 RepID=A9E409_9FLAO|nr:hypothetical protein [Kordia algicida]EDP95300.1 hypothetical protein KAOT1_09516 [Kordia algicida OT-1]